MLPVSQRSSIMSNNHLRHESPCSSEYFENVKKRSSCNQTGNNRVMNAHLNNRTNDRNSGPMINSGLPDGGSCYFPFWARKCGCAECIIASDKMGSKSLNNNQNGYQNSRQSECFSQKRNGYNDAGKTRERLGEHQVYNTKHTPLGNGNGITVWPEKDRFTASSDKMQTFDLNSYLRQNKADPRTSKLYPPNALSQSATMPVVDKTNSFTQLLNTESVMKDNEAVPNYWPWCSTSYESCYQNQQHLSKVHQTYTTKQLSRDPRLMNRSESFTGNGALISNKSSVGHGNAQERVSEVRNTDGYRRQSEEKNTKRYQEETEHSFLQGTTTAKKWWNVSQMNQYPKPVNAPTINRERSAPAVRMETNNNVTGDEWKGQRTWGKQPMQLTLKELSNKRNTNDAFLQGTDSHKPANPWNHPSPPSVKTCRPSAAELQNGTKWTPELENLGSKNIREMGDLESFKNRNSLQKKQQLRIDQKENDQDAKSLEICAREERIRKLKSLLVQHEQALETLRFQRKSASSDETNGNIVNIVNNETLTQKSSDREDRSEEEYCSSSDAILGKSLKRRWLKNWNEEDQLEHSEPPVKIEKRKEIHSHGTLSEDGNQNLSNAEFTALEGLVRLSKD